MAEKENRALVATSAVGAGSLRAVLAECRADFITDYAKASRRLDEQRYCVVIVGLQFGDSRMFDFIRQIRERQPRAWIVCVLGAKSRLPESTKSGVRRALEVLGVREFLDLTTATLSAEDRQILARIAELCGRKASASSSASGRI